MRTTTYNPRLYERPRMVFTNVMPEVPSEMLRSTAELVFADCKNNGYSKQLCAAYNMLVSAKTYLETGEPMHASRAPMFFEDVAYPGLDLTKDQRFWDEAACRLSRFLPTPQPDTIAALALKIKEGVL